MMIFKDFNNVDEGFGFARILAPSVANTSLRQPAHTDRTTHFRALGIPRFTSRKNAL